MDEVGQAGGCAAAVAAQAVAVPVVGEDGQLVDVVGGGAPGHGVGAAGVVADHAAEGAAAVRRRVGAEGQPVRAGRLPQPVQDQAGLHGGGAGRGVQVQQAAHVAGEVQHHAPAGGLSRGGRAAAAGRDGHLVGAADLEGGGHVVAVAGGDDADGDAAVVGRVHGRQRPRRRPEVHVPAHGAAQVPGQVRTVSHVPMMPTGGATAPAQRASARTARPRAAPRQDRGAAPGPRGAAGPAPRACTGRCGTAPHRDSRLLEGPEGRPAPGEAEAEKPGSKDVSITTDQR